MNRKFVAVIVVLLAVCTAYLLSKEAPRDGIPTIAIFNLVSHPILDASVEGIKKELRESGYVNNKVKIIEINANGQMAMLNSFAQEILGSRPTIIVPVSTPVTQAVVQTAPDDQAIVYSTVTNPSDVGMDNKPLNMTGVSDGVDYAANLTLIRDILPKATKIGMVYNPGERNSQVGIQETKKLIESMGYKLTLASVGSSNEVADATRTIVQQVDVIYLGPDNTVSSAVDAVVAIAKEARVPVFASDGESVKKGALAAVSVNYESVGRQVGKIVVKLLETDLQPGQIENVVFMGDVLMVNKSTASFLGIELPSKVLNKAVKIIP